MSDAVFFAADTYTFWFDKTRGETRMKNGAGVELCMGCGQPVDVRECDSLPASGPDPED